jgi:hypothetical protein
MTWVFSIALENVANTQDTGYDFLQIIVILSVFICFSCAVYHSMLFLPIVCVPNKKAQEDWGINKKAEIFHIGRLGFDIGQYYGWVVLLLLDFWEQKFSTQVMVILTYISAPTVGNLWSQWGKLW